MNTNTILKSLFNNELSIADVKRALDIHTAFLKNAQLLIDAGMNVTVTMKVVEDEMVRKVAETLQYHTSDIVKFKEANPMEHDPRVSFPFTNKIQLIKDFRNKFGCGLANAKYAVEMLYTGESITEPR
jgi:hypothetical protein